MSPEKNFLRNNFSSFTSQRRVGELFFQVTSCANITNSFCVDPVNLSDKTSKQEELVDIQSDETAKQSIMHAPLFKFWLSMPFCTLYLLKLFPAIRFSYHVEMRARIFNAVECKIKKLKLFYCTIRLHPSLIIRWRKSKHTNHIKFTRVSYYVY